MNKNIDYKTIIFYYSVIYILTYVIPWYIYIEIKDKKFLLYRYFYDTCIYLLVYTCADILYEYNAQCDSNYLYFIFTVIIWLILNFPNIFKFVYGRNAWNGIKKNRSIIRVFTGPDNKREIHGEIHYRVGKTADSDRFIPKKVVINNLVNKSDYKKKNKNKNKRFTVTIIKLHDKLDKPVNEITTNNIKEYFCKKKYNSIKIQKNDKNGEVMDICDKTLVDFDMTQKDAKLYISLKNRKK